jgi:O-antigen/teichoic acid export membrane protein
MGGEIIDVKESLKSRVIGGLGWNVTGSVGIQALNFIAKIFLARLLFPEDFGLFAMAFIVITFLSIFVSFGVTDAIIYRKKDEEYQKTIDSGMVVSIGIGCILMLLGFISSSFVADFFHEPILTTMIRLMSVVLLFDSISDILYGILIKEMEFKRKTIAELSSTIIYVVTVLLLAYYGFGVWSMVYAYLIQHFLIIVFLWILSPRKPKFALDKEIAKDMLHFGKHTTSAVFFAWAITSIDNILVGKRFGDEQLGYYGFGFTIASVPVLSLAHIIAGVFHPVYAKVRDNIEKLQKAYLIPLEWALLLILPISMGLFALADIFVIVVFGEKWITMVPILKVLALYAIIRSVCTICGTLLVGIGKPKEVSKIACIQLITLLIIIYPFASFLGIVGVALAVLIARGISLVMYIIKTNEVLKIKMKSTVAILWKKVLGTVIMLGTLYNAALVLHQHTIVNLLLLILIGVITYAGSIFLLDRRIFAEAKEMMGTLR